MRIQDADVGAYSQDNSSAKNDGLLLPSIELTPGCATSTSTSSSTKDIRHKLRAVAHTNGGIDMAALFLSRFYERDDSAGVSFEEFRSVLRRDAKVTAAAVGDEGARKRVEAATYLTCVVAGGASHV